ncbi:hypothetical protein [Streptomyces sp. SP18CS02]|uniref:hypothetical protein n=1 Tax=Streptomyces sp. SP18CS02 TaxID=3002531 RepID=UPI002E7AAC5B|nr:hypothetical protein [Streptomyces sp. SP18CS02]MEE1752123.1 hypothetical protein [Streptomyces sp. SP18CS02]
MSTEREVPMDRQQQTSRHPSTAPARPWGLRPPVACLLVLVALLSIGVRQLDGGLGRIEAPGHPSATPSGLFTLAAWSSDARDDARTAWCVWFQALPDAEEQRLPQGTASDPGPDERVTSCVEAFGVAPDREFVMRSGAAQPRLLLRWLAGLDILFVLGCAFLLHRALTVLAARIPVDAPVEESPSEAALRWSVGRRLRWALIGPLVVAGVVEGACRFSLSLGAPAPRSIDVLNRVAGLAAVAEWILASVIALFLVLLVVQTWRPPVNWWEDVKILRLQIAVSVLLLLVLTGVGTDQMQDALLGVLDHWHTAVGTLAAVAVLALLLWRSVHRTALTDDAGLDPVPVLWIAAPGVVCLGFGAFFWRNLLGLGAVLVAVAVLSWIAGAPAAFVHRRDELGRGAARAAADERARLIGAPRLYRLGAAARLLAALPLLVLGVFAVRSATATAVAGPGRRWALAVVLAGTAVALSSVAVPYALRRAERRNRWWALSPADGGGHGLYAALTAVCLFLAFVTVTSLTDDDPGSVAALMGPVAVAAIFLGLVLVLLNEAQRWSERATPVAGFRVLRLSRTPVFALILVWFLAASAFDTGGHHAVRVDSGGRPLADGDGDFLADRFERWAAANCAIAGSGVDAAGGARDEEPVPLVIVAASGGGIRAAYWTGGVLDRLFPPGPAGTAGASGCPPDRRAPVFAVSGISGGSLGAVSWLSRTGPPSGVPKGPRDDHKSVFGADHLSPAVAWMVFVDLPRAFIGFPGKDRAAVLEQSWENRQEALKDPFYASWLATPQPPPAARSWTPLALLNGTAVESGCRVLTSPVQAGAFDRPAGALSCTRRPEDALGSQDGPGAPTLIDLRGSFLCGDQDVKRSTAALLSARFPYITPSGRLSGSRCPDEGNRGGHLSVVDGGYVEATGSLTAFDLHGLLRPLVDCHNAGGTFTAGRCVPGNAAGRRRIRPVLVQIDNGYNSVATRSSPGRPSELLVPVQGLSGVSGTKDATARQRAFGAFGCENYLRFANVRGPGAQAPLGWVMSLSAQADLDRQLRQQRDGPGAAALTLEGQLAHAAARCAGR